jgi:hypothetical protein
MLDGGEGGVGGGKKGQFHFWGMFLFLLYPKNANSSFCEISFLHVHKEYKNWMGVMIALVHLGRKGFGVAKME